MRKQFTNLLCALLLIAVLAGCGGKPSAKWQESYDLGIRFVSEGNYEEAILAFQAAIAIDPKQPDAYLDLAEVYVQASQPYNAMLTLQQAPEAVQKTDAMQQAMTDLTAATTIVRVERYEGENGGWAIVAYDALDRMVWRDALDVSSDGENTWEHRDKVHYEYGEGDSDLPIRITRYYSDFPHLIERITEYAPAGPDDEFFPESSEREIGGALYIYDETGNLERLDRWKREEDGSRHTWSYNGEEVLTAEFWGNIDPTDPNRSRQLQYDYDDAGNLTGWTIYETTFINDNYCYLREEEYLADGSQIRLMTTEFDENGYETRSEIYREGVYDGYFLYTCDEEGGWLTRAYYGADGILNTYEEYFDDYWVQSFYGPDGTMNHQIVYD